MRYKLFRAWIICLLACVMSSCSRSPHLSGYIYSFASNYFTVTDLRTGKVIANKWLPKDIDVNYAVKIDNHRIILSDNFMHTWIYDRLTGKIKPYSQMLYTPSYMPKYKAILFYWGKNSLNTLNQISLDMPTRNMELDALSNKGEKYSAYYPIIAVSDDEVVYSPENNRVRYYNLKSNQAGYLPIKDCVAMAWRSKTQQLLCFHAQGKLEKYYLIHLDGTGRVELNKLKPFGRVFWYSPEYDTLVVSAGFLEGFVLRAYDFSTEKTIQFGSGAASLAGVWFPDMPPAAREALKSLPNI